MLDNPFLFMAFLTGWAASITSGIVGSYVVVKRIVFISGSIAHSVLGGMGICLWLRRVFDLAWLSPLYGALFSALASALFIGWTRQKYKEREDTVIAVLWATGMSIGVVFIALTPGYNVELLNFLFGNILWVSRADLFSLLFLDAVVIATVALFHKKFLAICFDEEQATLQGVAVQGLYLLLLCLVAISVVLLIQTVGAILVISMLAIPAATASIFTHNLARMMNIAIGLGFLFTSCGITASYYLNWPPGATISLLAALFYALCLAHKKAL